MPGALCPELSGACLWAFIPTKQKALCKDKIMLSRRDSVGDRLQGRRDIIKAWLPFGFSPVMWLHSPSSCPLNIWPPSTMCWHYPSVRPSLVYRLFWICRRHHKNGLVAFDSDWEGGKYSLSLLHYRSSNNHKELADNSSFGRFGVWDGFLFCWGFFLSVNSVLWDKEVN